MKYIITESQYKLISELDRRWRDFEYKEQYENIKDKLIPFFANLIDSYSERDSSITLYDSYGSKMIVYNKNSGELYYDRLSYKSYEEMLPHPFWLRHDKYILADMFNEYFPNYEVKSVKSLS